MCNKKPRVVNANVDYSRLLVLLLLNNSAVYSCVGIIRIRFNGCNLSLYLFSISTPSMLFACKCSHFFSHTNMKGNFSFF